MPDCSRTRPTGAAAARVGAALLLVGLAACTDAAPAADADAPASGPAAPLQGVFGTAARAVGGIPSVVTLEPAGGRDSSTPTPAGEVVIDQLGLAFVPRHVIVRVGGTLRVNNGEAIQHNVHLRRVADGATVLNADTPPNESIAVVLDREGGYDLLCDAHPGMTGMVYATTAQYAVLAAADGAFRFEDVPPGSYTLRVWSLDEGARVERTVTVAGARTELSPMPVG